MSNFNRTHSKTNYHYRNVVVFVIGLLIGGFCATLYFENFSNPFNLYLDVTTDPDTEFVKEVDDPVEIRIPTIDLTASFEGSLGINDDQTIAVPETYHQVGWYEHAPKPGELGPAVILGHVDSFLGPAVFHGLQRTKPGDLIEIDRVDETTAIFKITELKHHSRNTFPTEEVYGDLDYAGLRLITCSGTFDRGKQIYSHNLIVFAELVEDSSPIQPQ